MGLFTLGILVIVAFIPRIRAASHDPGVIYLDDLSFGRVVNGFSDVLVRFDKEYPRGKAHNMFLQLAATMGEADADLIVAGVPLSNREDYLLNPRLARRYGLHRLTDEDLPRFLLFLRGTDPRVPLNYTGPMEMDAIAAWLVAETSLFLGRRGQLEPLDAVAKQLTVAKPEERQKLLSQAQREADKLAPRLSPLQKGYSAYYLKTMQRVVDQGDGFLAKEVLRLSRLMADARRVPASALETFQWKLNVLSSFVPLAAPAEKKKKKKGRRKQKQAAGGKKRGGKAAAGKAAGGKAGGTAEKRPAVAGAASKKAKGVGLDELWSRLKAAVHDEFRGTASSSKS